MFATETGELVRYSNAVKRGTVLNVVMVLMTLPCLISIFLAHKLQAWVQNATFTACGVTLFVYFLLEFILTEYTYLQYLPGLLCVATFLVAVITRLFRSWATLSLLAVLTVSMLITFAVMTGLSWSGRLLKPELQSKMMPVIYTKK